MTSTRDDFSLKTKHLLAHRAGHRCSAPECRVSTSGSTQGRDDGVINVGVAAHITAASPNGPRYDATLTEEERRAPDNGIWLCTTHAKVVDDDEGHFTVEQLREWKRTAEERANREVGRAPSVGSPPTSASPKAKTVFPILPHFTALVHEGRSISPRNFALWVSPNVDADLTEGEARAAVVSGAGAPGWCALPMAHGRDLSDAGHAHRQLGQWVGLWTVDMGERASNRRVATTVGMSDLGVLAWQLEEAHDAPHEVFRLADAVTEIGSFVGMAHRVYGGLDELDGARLRVHAAVDTPRFEHLTLETLGLFESPEHSEFRVKATGGRLRAKATLDLEVSEAEAVGALTHKLTNQLLASCKCLPPLGERKGPPVASLDRRAIDRLLPR